MQITWDYDGWFAEFARAKGAMTARAKNTILTNANRKTVEFWHRSYIPRHFESGAASRYRYQARKRPYKRIKIALAEGRTFQPHNGNGEIINDRVIKGGRVSLVRSGDTEKRARQKQLVTATPGRASGRVLVPRYVSRRRRSGQPNMRQELQRLTAAERAGLHSIWSKNFFRGVRQLGTSAMRVRRQS